jgi:23S rRNA pseudouridine1911/1915/1917 synthase
MNQLLHDRQIRKIYWAVVKNRPPDDEALLMHHMSRNREKNKSYAFASPRKNSQKAELKYKLIASSDHYYLLEVELLTGRHHQIRSQLSVIGCPIKGDLKYGAPRANEDASIHLHARTLQFVHPVLNEMLTITAPTPPDPLWEYFERMQA